MKKQDLINGYSFHLYDKYANHVVSVEYSKSLCGNSHFKIWMNGKIVKMAKTFNPIKKKVDELALDFNLTAQSNA